MAVVGFQNSLNETVADVCAVIISDAPDQCGDVYSLHIGVYQVEVLDDCAVIDVSEQAYISTLRNVHT